MAGVDEVQRNSRERVRMTDPEVWEFLREPNVATFCSLNADHTIHAAAMFYGFLDGRLAVHTKRKSQKIRNVLRTPTITVLVEDGRQYRELRGVQVVGRGTVLDDPSLVAALSAEMNARYGWGRSPEEAGQSDKLRNRVVLSVDVDRIASWDHRKLDGGPLMADDRNAAGNATAAGWRP